MPMWIHKSFFCLFDNQCTYRDSGDCRSCTCWFFRPLVSSSLAWDMPQRMFLLYKPYFTLGHAHTTWVLGVFLSLQSLRDVECRCEPDWPLRNTQCPSHLRKLVNSMRDAVFTVSPKRQYRGILYPTTPATQGPGKIQGREAPIRNKWEKCREMPKAGTFASHSGSPRSCRESMACIEMQISFVLTQLDCVLFSSCLYLSLHTCVYPSPQL